jgi:hypothetical protein
MTHPKRSTERFDNSSGPADQQADSIGHPLQQAGSMAEQLQTALSVLATIDEAIGILISRGGGSAEDAIAVLRQVSRSNDIDVATVARRIVESLPRQPDTGTPPLGDPDTPPAQ